MLSKYVHCPSALLVDCVSAMCTVQCWSEAVGVSGSRAAAQDEGASARRGDGVRRPRDRRTDPVDDTV